MYKNNRIRNDQKEMSDKIDSIMLLQEKILKCLDGQQPLLEKINKATKPNEPEYIHIDLENMSED
jgi:hypothetical protein